MTTLETTAPGAIADIAGVYVPRGLFIDGQWRPATGGHEFSVWDPSTELELTRVADGTVHDALDALDAADRAQTSWGRTAPQERAEILRTAYELIRQRREDFARVITAEIGRPLAESGGEVDYAAAFFRWFAHIAERSSGTFTKAPGGSFDILTAKVPVGPSLLITPWNFPLAMGTRKLGAALAAGCTAVMKPAAQTPLTAALLVTVLHDAGLPAGVVNLVPTSDAATQSAALMADQRLRKISFTGSTKVGSTLLHQAAENVLRTSMELGGNGPFIVLDDADIDAAVEGAMRAKFRNAGQSCVAANRFLVHASIAQEFTDKLTRRTAALRTGNGFDPTSQVGPLIEERQRERLDAMVREAVDAGATVLTGGGPLPGPGYFYQPTVLTDVPDAARIRSEEIFGPVAVVSTVTNVDDAVASANSTAYGLAAFLYTQDINRAFDVASRIEAGMVGINRGLVSEPAAPFGGVKSSGLGREGGEAGIEEFLETKYYALERTH